MPCCRVSMALRWKEVSTQWVMLSIPSPAEWMSRPTVQFNCEVWIAGWIENCPREVLWDRLSTWESWHYTVQKSEKFCWRRRRRGTKIASHAAALTCIIVMDAQFCSERCGPVHVYVTWELWTCTCVYVTWELWTCTCVYVTWELWTCTCVYVTWELWTCTCNLRVIDLYMCICNLRVVDLYMCICNLRVMDLYMYM